jgi:predicted nuclease of restriction endonuclease-like (RecB) superfamily
MPTIPPDQVILPSLTDYRNWLASIKQRIARAQIRMALSANKELISLYYELGEKIVEREKNATWGSAFIDQFSRDLKADFPDISGFSAKNLRYCRAFYRFYSDTSIWQQAVAKLDDANTWPNAVDSQLMQAVAQLPWSHNILIFTKASQQNEARFYIQQTLENGWSREVLGLQIKSNLYQRAGAVVSNFAITLPQPQSELVQQTLKDPYVFDFLTMTAPYNEDDIERQLVAHITTFLLELGKGFAFIGRQYPVEVGGTEYFIDLLFYHVILKCYVVVELKNKKFIPEYAGKLNFYLSAVDSLIKRDDDNPTIGLLLCRDKNAIEVEFALRDMQKPMGVSEYTLTEHLPENLKNAMPTVAEIEADFGQLT